MPETKELPCVECNGCSEFNCEFCNEQFCTDCMDQHEHVLCPMCEKTGVTYADTLIDTWCDVCKGKICLECWNAGKHIKH